MITPRPQVHQAATQSKKRRRIGKLIGPYFFLLPATLFLVIFLLYPVCTMLLFSFEQVNIGTLLTGDTPFVGLSNYSTILTDPVFRSSIAVSIVFTVACLVFQFSLGFLLALLFNRRI